LVACALILCSGVLCAGSAQAQITKIAKIGNDDGRTLFVNAEPPIMMKITPRRNSIFLPAETSITGRVHPSMNLDRDGAEKLVREAAERHRQAGFLNRWKNPRCSRHRVFTGLRLRRV